MMYIRDYSFYLVWILGMGVMALGVILVYMKLFEWMTVLFGIKRDFVRFMLRKKKRGSVDSVNTVDKGR